MLIKKIIAICKKRKKLVIWNGKGVQYISDGAAIYPLYDMPVFDERSICAAFDVAADKVDVSMVEGVPAAFDFSDAAGGERQIDGSLMPIGEYVPYSTSDGVRFLRREYLGPFCRDVDISIFERRDTAGEIYFAVKRGFCLVAVLTTEKVLTLEFMKRLNELNEKCRLTYIAESGGDVSGLYE